MKAPFIFRDLLQLKNSREAKKLSLLSGQTKTEKFLLAENEGCFHHDSIVAHCFRCVWIYSLFTPGWDAASSK